jgi:putative FmdB family regulatory protein
MATYEYRCFQCGVVERDLTSGSAPASVTCSSCGREARRVYSPPMVYRTANPVGRALEREEKSRYEPEAVTQVAPRNRQPPAASEHPRPAPQAGPQNRIIHTITGGMYA